MKTRMLPLLCCAFALSSQAQTTRHEMWTWRDANGVTHFSDKPAPGATRIEIVGSTPAAAPQPPPTAASPAPPVRRPVRAYTALEFVAPARDEVFFGAGVEVPATLRATPGIMEGDELTWYLDGNRVDAAANATSFTFRDLPRGTHTVTAVIRDADGVEMIRALSRSFTVRQNAADNPRNLGPALRPRPVPLPAPAPAPPPAPRPTSK